MKVIATAGVAAAAPAPAANRKDYVNGRNLVRRSDDGLHNIPLRAEMEAMILGPGIDESFKSEDVFSTFDVFAFRT